MGAVGGLWGGPTVIAARARIQTFVNRPRHETVARELSLLSSLLFKGQPITNQWGYVHTKGFGFALFID